MNTLKQLQQDVEVSLQNSKELNSLLEESLIITQQSLKKNQDLINRLLTLKQSLHDS